ncbi:hypothetical protein EOPP23_07055 [Endozoicomonas sp. OPT23]|uniref:Mpo1 family 2-hydroxy fatty acid dioxygenase n=1 Tax=Endozoicomonas sp. OPT23 TaxID=2072845 RepID=UPI00129AC635|nr:Mpo1-like protein [Endozoicomonas sp. OPT23]MRI32744.1 hypothetical protein [Endozoicomonas sp. OPT23]
MKTINEWFDAYGESHQNPINKLIHWICVPAIMLSIIGMLWALSPWLVYAVMAVTLIFYLSLSVPLSAIMLVIYAFMITIAEAMGSSLLSVSICIFVVAWIFQFIGHSIEGKKPSFFDDVKFLLVGPLWCLSFLFDRWNLKY